jgi:sugar phosphate permease
MSTAAKESVAKIGKFRWAIVTLVALATIINYIDRGALGFLWPEISDELGLTKVDYAIILNVFPLARRCSGKFSTGSAREWASYFRLSSGPQPPCYTPWLRGL